LNNLLTEDFLCLTRIFSENTKGERKRRKREDGRKKNDAAAKKKCDGKQRRKNDVRKNKDAGKLKSDANCKLQLILIQISRRFSEATETSK